MGKLIDLDRLSRFKDKLVHQKYLGSLSTLEELNTALNTELASMKNFEWKSIYFHAAVMFDTFAGNAVLYGILYRGGSGAWAHVMFYPNAAFYIISGYIGNVDEGDTWSFRRMATKNEVDNVQSSLTTVQNKVDSAVSLDNFGDIASYNELTSSLNDKLIHMPIDSWCTFRFKATTAFDVFKKDCVYYGTLYRYTYTTWARAIFYCNSDTDIVTGQIPSGGSWNFDSVTLDKKLGEFTTKDELNALLNAELAVMPVHSHHAIYVIARANVDELFINGRYYHGVLYSNTTGAYAHVILYDNASTKVITGYDYIPQGETSATWVYGQLASETYVNTAKTGGEKSLGSVATEAALTSALNAELANMAAYSWLSFNVTISANVGVFKSGALYHGKLFRGPTSSTYAHVMMNRNATGDIITGDVGTGATGTYKLLATHNEVESVNTKAEATKTALGDLSR